MDININVNLDFKEANKVVDKLLAGLKDIVLLTQKSVLSIPTQTVKPIIEKQAQIEEVKTEEEQSNTEIEEAKTEEEQSNTEIEEPLYTLEETRAELRTLTRKKGAEFTKTLLIDTTGVGRITDVPKYHYNALMRAIKEVK